MSWEHDWTHFVAAKKNSDVPKVLLPVIRQQRTRPQMWCLLLFFIFYFHRTWRRWDAHDFSRGIPGEGKKKKETRSEDVNWYSSKNMCHVLIFWLNQNVEWSIFHSCHFFHFIRVSVVLPLLVCVFRKKADLGLICRSLAVFRRDLLKKIPNFVLIFIYICSNRAYKKQKYCWIKWKNQG